MLFLPLLLTALLEFSHAIPADQPAIEVKQQIVDGFDPGIRLTGLAPQEKVRLHAFRSLEKWQNDKGEWKRVSQPLHAWAEFTVSAEGTVEVSKAAPLSGTYKIADPLGLLRTGYRLDDPALSAVMKIDRAVLKSAAPDRVYLKLERQGSIIKESSFQIREVAEGIIFEEVKGDGWHAIYARPAKVENLSLVVMLHGSEGGSVQKARSKAASLANHGFAALAVNYFAYPHEAIPGVPDKHIDIKLEILPAIRDWSKKRLEIAQDQVSLYGVSKGAEFALLAASQYDWIKKVVAVVPSDIVWEGYAADAGSKSSRSSWSKDGKAWPFVELFQFIPTHEGVYRTNTERYERSRQHNAAAAETARIPIEKTKARLMLLGSDRDEVWASGNMSRKLVEQMVLAGKAAQVEVKIYPQAGHQLSGTGSFPIRLYGEQSSDPDAKDIVAEGEAAADSWKKTVAFLKAK